MSQAMTPLHPEATDAADTLRWVCPSSLLPFEGAVAQSPAPLQALVDDGRLRGVRLEATAVHTTLGPGLTWRAVGSEVRTALHSALQDHTEWVPEAGARSLSDDHVLADLAREALCGAAGDYVRSHGGCVDLIEVRDGVATVRLSGSCSGCPAIQLTVGGRLTRELLRACPQLREVRVG